MKFCVKMALTAMLAIIFAGTGYAKTHNAKHKAAPAKHSENKVEKNISLREFAKNKRGIFALGDDFCTVEISGKKFTFIKNSLFAAVEYESITHTLQMNRPPDFNGKDCSVNYSVMTNALSNESPEIKFADNPDKIIANEAVMAASPAVKDVLKETASHKSSESPVEPAGESAVDDVGATVKRVDKSESELEAVTRELNMIKSKIDESESDEFDPDKVISSSVGGKPQDNKTRKAKAARKSQSSNDDSAGEDSAVKDVQNTDSESDKTEAPEVENPAPPEKPKIEEPSVKTIDKPVPPGSYTLPKKIRKPVDTAK